MSRCVYQNIVYVSSSSDEESVSINSEKNKLKIKSTKRRRPTFWDHWEKVPKLKYLSSDEEEEQVKESNLKKADSDKSVEEKAALQSRKAVVQSTAVGPVHVSKRIKKLF